MKYNKLSKAILKQSNRECQHVHARKQVIRKLINDTTHRLINNRGFIIIAYPITLCYVRFIHDFNLM